MQRHTSILRKAAATAALALTVALASCTGGFEEFNTDPDAVKKVNLKGFITTMQIDVVPCSDIDANQYQRACNLCGDMFSGYMAAIGLDTRSNIDYYLHYDLDWNDPAYEVAYTQVLAAWKKLQNAHKNGNISDDVWAVAQILKVATMHRITDTYGPIPYIRFGEVTSAPYDRQSEIYARFFEELDDAIATLEPFAESTEKPLQNVDLVYAGDYAKWYRFANSLKLRLALRIVYADPANAQLYAEQAVRDGVMTSNADNAAIRSYNGTMVYNPINVCWDSYENCRIGAAIDSYMNGYQDARRSKYFQLSTISVPEGTEDKVNGYHGVYPGLSGGDTKSRYTTMSAPNVMKDTPVLWMNYAEVCFLRAEGAARHWNMGADAQTLYHAGIDASFEEHGVGGAEAYKNSEERPAAFTDAAGTGYNKAAVSTITVKWNTAADLEEQLERIITQKWIAMWPNGQEAWSEFRRTGYPKLFPVANNRSDGEIDSDRQIRRMVFPRTEYSGNRGEVLKGVALLNAESKNPSGRDTGGTQVWWDKK